jgi:hypothetical protein
MMMTVKFYMYVLYLQFWMQVKCPPVITPGLVRLQRRSEAHTCSRQIAATAQIENTPKKGDVVGPLRPVMSH